MKNSKDENKKQIQMFNQMLEINLNALKSSSPVVRISKDSFYILFGYEFSEEFIGKQFRFDDKIFELLCASSDFVFLKNLGKQDVTEEEESIEGSVSIIERKETSDEFYSKSKNHEGVSKNLEDCFRKQIAFQKHYFFDQEKLSEEDKQKYLHIFSYAIIEECAELNRFINWKFWKKSRKPFDELNIREEVSDILHFLFNILIVLGDKDTEKMIEHFDAKHQRNILRQEENY